MYNYAGLNPATSDPKYNVPTFAKQGSNGTSIWGAVFEKAWAKVKGNYLNANSGYNPEVTQSITGVT
jgi:Calpain family cysteine protease